MNLIFKSILLIIMSLGLMACAEPYNEFDKLSGVSASELESFLQLNESTYEATIVSQALSDAALSPGAIQTAAAKDDPRYQQVANAIAACPVVQLELGEVAPNEFRIQYSWSAPCPITGRMVMTLANSQTTIGQLYVLFEYEVVSLDLQALVGVRSHRTESNTIFQDAIIDELTGNYTMEFEGSSTSTTTMTDGQVHSSSSVLSGNTVAINGSVTFNSSVTVRYKGKTLTIRSVSQINQATGEATSVYYLNGQLVESIEELEALFGSGISRSSQGEVLDNSNEIVI